MYALFKNGNVLPWQEVDVAEIHDGDILIMSYDKEYLEKQGEWFKALDIVQQYKTFLCPFCSIINENTFGWIGRMMSRTKKDDHTPVKTGTSSKLVCPFCGLYPYERVDVGIGFMDVAVACCEYGDMYYGGGLPLEQVKAVFIEVEGYEPPYKDTYSDNRVPCSNYRPALRSLIAKYEADIALAIIRGPNGIPL